MAGPEAQVEQVVNKIVRGIFGLRDLLEHDLTLAVDLFGVKARFEEQVGEQVNRHHQVLAQNLGVIAGILLAGEGVEHTSDRVHLLGDLRGGALLGALEEQMFDEMRDAVL